jgi:hypothetical protein
VANDLVGAKTKEGATVEKREFRPVRVYKGSDKSEGAKLWCLKAERDGVCTGCGGRRVATHA